MGYEFSCIKYVRRKIKDMAALKNYRKVLVLFHVSRRSTILYVHKFGEDKLKKVLASTNGTTRKNTGCPRRNGQNFGRVFLMLNYTDITQNTYIQS